jgi:hypothetical protein
MRPFGIRCKLRLLPDFREMVTGQLPANDPDNYPPHDGLSCLSQTLYDGAGAASHQIRIFLTHYILASVLIRWQLSMDHNEG